MRPGNMHTFEPTPTLVAPPKIEVASDSSAALRLPLACRAAAGGTGSGNYIFQPNGSATYAISGLPGGAPASVRCVSGDIVSEVRHVLVAESVEAVYRLYDNADHLEVEYRPGCSYSQTARAKGTDRV